jgi:hypothetical protein
MGLEPTAFGELQLMPKTNALPLRQLEEELVAGEEVRVVAMLEATYPPS